MSFARMLEALGPLSPDEQLVELLRVYAFVGATSLVLFDSPAKRARFAATLTAGLMAMDDALDRMESEAAEQKGLWLGDPVKPRPVSEEYIRALRDAGAREGLIAALEEDRRKAKS